MEATLEEGIALFYQIYWKPRRIIWDRVILKKEQWFSSSQEKREKLKIPDAFFHPKIGYSLKWIKMKNSINAL